MVISTKERETMIRLRASGMACAEIAKRLGRCRNSVIAHTQQLARRKPRYLTFDGESMTLRAWSRRLGISHTGLAYRLRSMSLETAIQLCMHGQRPRKPGIVNMGNKQHPLYQTWKGMKKRCSNPREPGYRRYGGRGIRVCARWRNNFAAFVEDMGPKPSSQHSLDRIDNNGDYEPENCRWASPQQQARNMRSSKRLTFKGETLTQAEWAERYGISQQRLHQRLRRGLSLDDALKPVRVLQGAR